MFCPLYVFFLNYDTTVDYITMLIYMMSKTINLLFTRSPDKI